MSAPVRITSYIGGGGVTAFVGIFVVMGASSGAGALVSSGLSTALAYGIAFGLAAAALLTLYVVFSAEYVADVDAAGVRFAVRRRVGPFRGSDDVIVSTRWSEAKHVREEVRVSRTRHGDIQRRYTLRIDAASIDGGLLGTMQRDGKYLELIRAVEAALGRPIPQNEVQD